MWILSIFLVPFEIYPWHPRQVLSSFILFTGTKLGKFLPANNDKAELKKPNFVGVFSGITGRKGNISPKFYFLGEIFPFLPLIHIWLSIYKIHFYDEWKFCTKTICLRMQYLQKLNFKRVLVFLNLIYWEIVCLQYFPAGGEFSLVWKTKQIFGSLLHQRIK